MRKTKPTKKNHPLLSLLLGGTLREGWLLFQMVPDHDDPALFDPAKGRRLSAPLREQRLFSSFPEKRFLLITEGAGINVVDIDRSSLSKTVTMHSVCQVSGRPDEAFLFVLKFGFLNDFGQGGIRTLDSALRKRVL